MSHFLLPKNKKKIKKRVNDSSAIDLLPSPLPGRQTEFYNCAADIVLFGGAAGGGKTTSILLDFARPEFLANPQYNGVIFRRTYPEIKNPGGILDESQKMFNLIGGDLTQNPLDWKFKSGAKIVFRHLQYEKTKHEYQGAQLGRIGFDELTHFSETQFFYMLSRN